MSKVLCYISCHYGKDYIGYAIKSVYPYVDRIVIFYTPKPSFGHGTDAVCPENSSDIRRAASAFGDPRHKIFWIEGQYGNEGHHRRVAEEYAENMGFDTLFALDYDEVWQDDALHFAINFVAATPKRIFRVPMIHFWRSFSWACKDLAQPVRFTKLNEPEGESYIPLGTPVYHFGYAITDKMMRYKWQIHGHKNELRDRWFEDVWDVDRRTDVHPTCEQDFWTPERFSKTKLPIFMRKHPFYKEGKIA